VAEGSDRRNLEGPRADARDTQCPHAPSHRVVARRLAILVQVKRDPRLAVGAVRVLVEAQDLDVEIAATLLTREGTATLGLVPAVVAGARDVEESGHALHFEVRALHSHQCKSLCFGGLEAKYAAAFPRKARSFSCSAT
jgi:hypothetical protein